MLVLTALLLKGAKLLKFVKLLKVASPAVLFLSMSISVIAYAFWMGPWLAIVFVVLLLIHEMGHVVAMRLKGFDTPTPVFIPFLGAAIFAPKFKDRDSEAYVGYGGPLLGTIGSIAAFGLYFTIPKDSTWSPVMLVGSYLGVFLNLFNLLPISPLDGGRVTQAAGRWFKYVGLIALALFTAYFRQPVILYVWILVLFDLDMVPVRLRAVLITVLWITMATLMYLGYGDQPVFVNIFDCVITLLFVFGSIARAVTLDEDPEKDTRPELTGAQRVRWFIVYAALIGVLFVTILVQTPHLNEIAELARQ